MACDRSRRRARSRNTSWTALKRMTLSGRSSSHVWWNTYHRAAYRSANVAVLGPPRAYRYLIGTRQMLNRNASHARAPCD